MNDSQQLKRFCLMHSRIEPSLSNIVLGDSSSNQVRMSMDMDIGSPILPPPLIPPFLLLMIMILDQNLWEMRLRKRLL